MNFLEQRIDSVLNQTFQDLEVIILDDCSTDNSREIIELYRDHPRVSHIIYNESNTNNTFKQWNKGIGLALGEFVWIAESDDYCEPTFVCEIIEPLMADENIVLGFCQSLLFSETEEVLSVTKASKIKSVENGEIFALEKMMGTTSIPNASMAIFRKSAVTKIQDDYKQMSYCGDWLFWTSICLLGKVFISGKVLNYYRRHGGNVASKSINVGLDFIEGNKVFTYLMKTCSPDDRQIKNALYQRADLYLKLRYLFSSSTDQAVMKSLLEIEPCITSIIRVLKVRYFLENFYNNNARNYLRNMKKIFSKI